MPTFVLQLVQARRLRLANEEVHRDNVVRGVLRRTAFFLAPSLYPLLSRACVLGSRDHGSLM